MATRNSSSPKPMGTAQGDPGEAGTLPGPDAGIRDTSSATQLKIRLRGTESGGTVPRSKGKSPHVCPVPSGASAHICSGGCLEEVGPPVP